MKIVSFSLEAPEGPRFGALLDGGAVLDFCHEACGIPQPASHLDWFDTAGAAHTEARSLYAALGEREADLRAAGAIRDASMVQLLAPVPRPGKVMCIGLNYKDHAEESGLDLPERPLLFSKFPTSIVGPDATVIRPPGCTDLDYEAEFVVVIGRRASRVSAADAMDHVLGYCNGNDVSARDFQFADGQWVRGKACDTFGPIGPFLATADSIADPHALRIQLRLNGETLQDSNTDQLIFRIPELIEALSAVITLEPGDVIYTGTPPGVGFARKPPVWVRPGDKMEVEIEGLGILTNPVAE